MTTATDLFDCIRCKESACYVIVEEYPNAPSIHDNVTVQCHNCYAFNTVRVNQDCKTVVHLTHNMLRQARGKGTV